MPDSDSRRSVSVARVANVTPKAIVKARREGRRSLSAYESHARGQLESATPAGGYIRSLHAPSGTALVTHDAGASSAGIAFALVFPLLGASRRARRSTGDELPHGSGKGNGMKRKPSIKCLETVTLDEAKAYLEWCRGNELDAAFALASDRNRLDGASDSGAAPDDAEVHHALFLLCRARGLEAPSFDQLRVDMRRRVAA
jgi:hypothetical protein